MKKCLFMSDLSFRPLKTCFFNLFLFLGFFLIFTYASKLRPWKSKFSDENFILLVGKSVLEWVSKNWIFSTSTRFFLFTKTIFLGFDGQLRDFFSPIFVGRIDLLQIQKMLQIVQIFIKKIGWPKTSCRGRFRL